MTDERPLQRLWYDAVHTVAMAVFTLGFSYRYEGKRLVPKTGPALFVANHQSFVDPLVVGMATSRHLVYLARKTLFRQSVFAAAIRSLNAVPIDQEGVGKEGIRAILNELKKGNAVLVFPEGSRTPDGNLHELRPGIHLLIKRTEAPIVPVGIAGAYDAYPIWRNYPIPAPLFLPATERTIAVSIGQPLEARRFAELPRDQAMAELYNELQKAHVRAEKLRRK
ncbi:MAG: 1-acyl-sn-glycerol-3-phosphate acyltransferase [Planctomycetes bacterium]|nr:1-acyl-sn-glycerol-3-phosphate acyltransferase [Planctomycetota bacterium]